MKRNSAITGAAFLMATSAIGPGFLTQTALFTEQLLTSFGFVIGLSVLLDIGAQLNIWRVISISEMKAQDIANCLVPGLGYFLAFLIATGGLVFNIGNIAGCGLGLHVLTGMDIRLAAGLSGILAILLLVNREAGKRMDQFAKLLGLMMILLTTYIAFSSHPPVAEALYRTIWPEKIDWFRIITLVGGTVGGYISFAGAHRLLDAGIKGQEQLQRVNRSAVTGILITSLMRFILFFAALGIVMQGIPLDPGNPAATVFQSAAGRLGYLFFGGVIWAAAITSVVGASYTSVSFWKTLVPFVNRQEKWVTALFIIISTVIFISIGRPVDLLVWAGAINGFILPLALAVILIASGKRSLMKAYRHPLVLQVSGWVVVAVLLWMGIKSLL